jgi:hypothetical protein
LTDPIGSILNPFQALAGGLDLGALFGAPTADIVRRLDLQGLEIDIQGDPLGRLSEWKFRSLDLDLLDPAKAALQGTIPEGLGLPSIEGLTDPVGFVQDRAKDAAKNIITWPLGKRLGPIPVAGQFVDWIFGW